VVFFATVVVVDWGLVETFGATVLFDEAGLANSLVVVVAVNTDVGVAFCTAVVCGIIGKALVGMGDLFSPVAYEVVGPMLATF